MNVLWWFVGGLVLGSLLARIRNRSLRPSRFTTAVYVEHACFSAAHAAFMYGENPELSRDAVTAYKWAEREFVRIGNKRVGEHDLIG